MSKVLVGGSPSNARDAVYCDWWSRMSVSMSVMRLRWNEVLLAVETLTDPRNIILDGSSDFFHGFDAAFAQLTLTTCFSAQNPITNTVTAVVCAVVSSDREVHILWVRLAFHDSLQVTARWTRVICHTMHANAALWDLTRQDRWLHFWPVCTGVGSGVVWGWRMWGEERQSVLLLVVKRLYTLLLGSSGVFVPKMGALLFYLASISARAHWASNCRSVAGVSE